MEKVKFTPLERADLEDIKALTDLGYEYDSRELGALFGAADLSANSGGLLSGPSVTYTHSTGLLSLSSCVFLELSAGDPPLDSNGFSAAPEARVVRYDSSNLNHLNHPIDVSAHRTVGTTYTLYARSILIDADTSPRRRWDISAQTEVQYSPETRRRERIEFAVGTAKPAESTSVDTGKWVPLLTYSVDVTNVLSSSLLSVLDHADSKILSLMQPNVSTDKLDSSSFLSPLNQSPSHGLSSLMSIFKLALYRITSLGAFDQLHTPSSESWFFALPLSNQEVKLRIERLETRNQEVQDRATSLETIKHLLIRVESTWSTSLNTSFSRIDAPSGTSIIYDGSTMSGSNALGDAALSRQDFERAKRRPVVLLPSPPSGKQWKILNHNIIPLTAPSAPDSLTDTSLSPDLSPLEFNYSVLYALPSGSIPLSTDSLPGISMIKQGYSIPPATNPSTPAVYDNAIPFIIRMDPVLVSSEVKFIYDIQLMIQEVDI